MRLAIVVIGILLLLAVHTRAHDAGGWEYDRACCGGGDCDAIPSTSVRVVEGGFIVTLEPGDHPMVTRRHRFELPYTRPMYPGSTGAAVRISPDMRWHACLFPTEDTLRCLYIVPGGV